jgi:hypothetical protein
MEDVGILYYVHLVYFTAICHLPHYMAIGYISWLFGIFSPILVRSNKKNLATLPQMVKVRPIRSP